MAQMTAIIAKNQSAHPFSYDLCLTQQAKAGNNVITSDDPEQRNQLFCSAVSNCIRKIGATYCNRHSKV